MAFNIFVDSDVILDVLLKREGFYEDSYGIFILCEQEDANLYTSSSIILNVQYVGGRVSSKNIVAKSISYLLENFIEIINPNKQTILKAYKSDFTDYEDAIQYLTAKDAGSIDYFITRNVKDYNKATYALPVLTPSQFIKQLSK